MAGITDKVKSTKKGESMILMFGKSKHQINSLEREGRPCDTTEVLSQIGKFNVLAVCGGCVTALKDKNGDDVGVALFVTEKRRIEVILNWWDTYDVTRIHTDHRGTETVEASYTLVYCDQLEQMVWKASVWE